MKKTFFIFLLAMSIFVFGACGGGGGGGGDSTTPEPEDVVYTLSVATSGNGTVTYTEAGDDGGYKKGETLVLTATPDSGWRFDHWEGSISSTQKTVSIKVSGNLSVTAVFIQQFTLTTSYTGNGSVTVNPLLSIYDTGQEVIITATPASGWSFDHWSGSVTSTGNPLRITMDSDKTITAVFIKPSTLGLEEMKDVLHAAYSGIGYGQYKKYDSNTGTYYTYTEDDSKLYGIAFEDLRWLSDVISMNSIITLMNSINYSNPLDPVLWKMLYVIAGNQRSFALMVNGLSVKLDLVPNGKISTNPDNPSSITVKMTVGIPASGYAIQNLNGEHITYKGNNSSDLIFTGTGKAYYDSGSNLFGLYFESFTTTASSNLSAIYEKHSVQYKTWTVTASATGNEGKKLNYFIGPLMLYEYSEFQAPNYDHRFYKLNGTFSIDGEDYFYDMLYGQLDGRYKPTVYDANAKYISMKGSIRIPGLGGNLISISSPKSDLFEAIFNGKGIDTVTLGDINGAIKIRIVPDTGVWETGSLSMIQAGYSSGWDAVFSSDGSVEIDPGDNIITSWQKVLEFIN
ncbi:MAG TPA: hypothetical protein VIS94_06555 [Desulfomonilia bacterium]